MAKNVTIPSAEMNEFDLPRVCVMTGQTENVEFHEMKFQWYPRWIAIFIFGALIVALVLMVVMTKRVKGKLPFSPEGWERYRRGKRLVAFALLSFFGGLAFIFVAAATKVDALMFVALAAMILAPIVFGVLASRYSLPVVKITDTQITFKLRSDAAAQAFEQHLNLGPGSAAKAALA